MPSNRSDAMKKIVNKVFSIIVILAILACIGVSIPAAIRMVKDISATPAPDVPLTLDQACEYYDKVVEVEGRLELPHDLTCSTEAPFTCRVELFDPYWKNSVYLDIPVHRGSGNPPATYMAKLDNDYTRGDFYIVTSDNRKARDGSFISIKGKETGGASCAINHIESITILDRLVIDVGSDLQSLTLQEAVTEGLVVATITGRGLFQVDISITPKFEQNFEIIIEPGTIFISSSADVQNMVVREEQIIYLKPDLEIGLELEVSCANMLLDQPDYSNTFSVSSEPAAGDLQRLLALEDFSYLDLGFQQFSIWTITDNPVASYDYVGIESGGETRYPQENEIEIMKNLFIEAGIDTTNYLIFDSPTN